MGYACECELLVSGQLCAALYPEIPAWFDAWSRLSCESRLGFIRSTILPMSATAPAMGGSGTSQFAFRVFERLFCCRSSSSLTDLVLRVPDILFLTRSSVCCHVRGSSKIARIRSI